MKNDLFNLEGRSALVTGGSRGLGLAMAHQLADAGADVFICSRHEEELKSAAEKIAVITNGRFIRNLVRATCLILSQVQASFINHRNAKKDRI